MNYKDLAELINRCSKTLKFPIFAITKWYDPSSAVTSLATQEITIVFPLEPSAPVFQELVNGANKDIKINFTASSLASRITQTFSSGFWHSNDRAIQSALLSYSIPDKGAGHALAIATIKLNTQSWCEYVLALELYYQQKYGASLFLRKAQGFLNSFVMGEVGALPLNNRARNGFESGFLERQTVIASVAAGKSFRMSLDAQGNIVRKPLFANQHLNDNTCLILASVEDNENARDIFIEDLCSDVAEIKDTPDAYHVYTEASDKLSNRSQVADLLQLAKLTPQTSDLIYGTDYAVHEGTSRYSRKAQKACLNFRGTKAIPSAINLLHKEALTYLCVAKAGYNWANLVKWRIPGNYSYGFFLSCTPEKQEAVEQFLKANKINYEVQYAPEPVARAVRSEGQSSKDDPVFTTQFAKSADGVTVPAVRSVNDLIAFTSKGGSAYYLFSNRDQLMFPGKLSIGHCPPYVYNPLLKTATGDVVIISLIKSNLTQQIKKLAKPLDTLYLQTCNEYLSPENQEWLSVLLEVTSVPNVVKMCRYAYAGRQYGTHPGLHFLQALPETLVDLVLNIKQDPRVEGLLAFFNSTGNSSSLLKQHTRKLSSFPLQTRTKFINNWLEIAGLRPALDIHTPVSYVDYVYLGNKVISRRLLAHTESEEQKGNAVLCQ